MLKHASIHAISDFLFSFAEPEKHFRTVEDFIQSSQHLLDFIDGEMNQLIMNKLVEDLGIEVQFPQLLKFFRKLPLF